MDKRPPYGFLGLPSLAHISRDLPAGLVVFLVALPLCLGISLASGAPPLSGVISGIIGGLVVGWMSGSEKSVSGPAAGLAVIVLGAIQKLGAYETFALAVLLSGVIQIAFGFLRAGGIGDFIPHSVIKGMLAAIGLILVLKQIPHALGNDRDYVGDMDFKQADQLNTFSEITATISSISPGALLISMLSLAVLIGWETRWIRSFKWSGLVPPALVVMLMGTLVNEVLRIWMPAWSLTHEREQLVQLPVISSATEFVDLFRLPRFSDITQSAVWVTAATIAIVGSIESLLCLEATNKLDPEKRLSDPNRELWAQGVGNLLSGLVGGLPITSVIVRSSANIYAGARTRLSALLFLSRFLNHIPLAALAAILMAVGYKLASFKVMAQMRRQGISQFLPFLVTVVAIMATDLLRGICCGFLVGIFFVMRTNHHSAVTLVNEGKDFMLRFNKDMSFVNKQELKRRLREIPDGARLVVNGTRSLYVDHDVYEALEEFGTSAHYRGIQIEYQNVLGKELIRR
jgi:MFS superfamily sulfate permease-like transporter